ncbi:MucR family transcriptional regulator [Brevundimonas sp. 2R-24]|uniref:MucR family transcriptional regulator n=1 Tax=Peiella sedimenti TaxID=3061083 RepID=A0ABT8SQU9_9CAUL|nr:MucR family transcriptional regulator [Caulobacteraceae bacterium XZ-24]
MTETNSNLIELTAAIAEAYVSHNKVSAGEIAGLIASIHGTLDGIATGKADEPQEEPVAKPTAAQIRRSIQGSRLISFEDGKPYAALKRHLTSRGMTPAEYRAKWGLPSDYPMTAPDYSKARSDLAKSLGLGRGGRKPKGPAKGRRKAG